MTLAMTFVICDSCRAALTLEPSFPHAGNRKENAMSQVLEVNDLRHKYGDIDALSGVSLTNNEFS